jgi:hypothetical protein
MKALLLLFLSFTLVVSFAQGLVSQGDFILTPFGSRHNACVREIPNNAHIEENESGEIWVTSTEGQKEKLENLGLCSIGSPKTSLQQFPADYDGWLAYTTYNDPDGFDSFLGSFSVPEKPSQDPQVLYLFTGLQNNDWVPIVDPQPKTFDIIQPVLQYPGDNGQYWSVKSWYVTLTNDVLVTPEEKCEVGDNIFGNMTQTGSQSWFIGGTTENGQGKTVSLNVNRAVLKSQPWAFVTLECYGCDSCSDEPTNNSNFTGLALTKNGGQPVTPSWTASVSPNPVCHEIAHIVDPTNVYITFQK